MEDVRKAAEGVKGRETAWRLSWLLLRAASAIRTLFSAKTPPPVESITSLEAFLADLGVEAMLYAKRGVIDEREAREFLEVLFSSELTSYLGECKRGACKPVRVYEMGLRLWTLGVALQVGGREPPRACIPG